jgi:hypothetical protein
MSHYDTDFYIWTQEQAAALRTKDLTALDLEHLAEEIDSLGKRDRRSVDSYLEGIAKHVLKWTYQPTHRTPGWRHTVRRNQGILEEILLDSPSLGQVSPERLARLYRRARQGASEDTELPLRTLPATCPWTVEDLLAPNLLMEDPHA